MQRPKRKLLKNKNSWQREWSENKLTLSKLKQEERKLPLMPLHKLRQNTKLRWKLEELKMLLMKPLMKRVLLTRELISKLHSKTSGAKAFLECQCSLLILNQRNGERPTGLPSKKLS